MALTHLIPDGSDSRKKVRSGARCCFDIRKGNAFSPDEEGLELSTLQAVQKEAARSLADLAGDVIREWGDGAGHRMAIEARDDNGPVLVMKITFDSAPAVKKPTP